MRTDDFRQRLHEDMEERRNLRRRILDALEQEKELAAPQQPLPSHVKRQQMLADKESGMSGKQLSQKYHLSMDTVYTYITLARKERIQHPESQP